MEKPFALCYSFLSAIFFNLQLLLAMLVLMPTISHLAVVAELIALLFALVRADDELEVVSAQKLIRHIWAPVAPSTSQFVG